MIKRENPGERKTIICPNCDGTGRISNNEECGTQEILTCQECKGTGKIEGVVIKNG